MLQNIFYFHYLLKMRRFIVFIFQKKYYQYIFMFLFIFLFSCDNSKQDKKILNIYTYSSFISNYGPGKILKERFEKICSCSVVFHVTEDGITLIHRLQNEKENTKADIVLGFDSNIQDKAFKTDMFTNHNIKLPQLSLVNWNNDFFVPFDYSYFSLIYDKSKTSSDIKSFSDFLESDLSLIYPDPRVSTPGLGFMLWVNKLFPNNIENVWKKIAKKTVTVPSGWSEAYGLFLKGESSAVLSYTTSPLYHKIYENEDKYQAMIFDEGHYLQVELAGIVKTSKNKELSKLFLEFLLYPENQETIAYKNIMYPVLDLNEIDNISNEKVKFRDLVLPKKQLILDSDFIYQNIDKWTQIWEESILNE